MNGEQTGSQEILEYSFYAKYFFNTVFERIVYDQLHRYLTENKLLCCYQSGFRTLPSTVTALIEATDRWSLNVDRGFVNAVVFLDLKKAFDTVNMLFFFQNSKHMVSVILLISGSVLI